MMTRDPLAAGSLKPTESLTRLAISLEEERARRAQLDETRVKLPKEARAAEDELDPSYWLG